METRHEACSGRASLATASVLIRTDSGRAASRCHASVIALSTVVMRLDGFFPKFSLGMLAQQARRAVFKQQAARRAVFKAARAGLPSISTQAGSPDQVRR